MVNENFTNINKLKTAEIETDPFDQAFILLTRAWHAGYPFYFGKLWQFHRVAL